MRHPSKTAAGMKGVVFGLALLDAVVAQAGTAKVDGIRIIPGSAPQTEGDAFQRGRGLLALGDVPAALAAFRQALVADPQSTSALNGIAVCYDRLGRYDISRSYYEAALAIDPNSAVILNNFGYSLYLQGDYQTAITHLHAAGEYGDAQVSAASRRTLALIAAQPHNADADTATVQLQPGPVAAYIERTSGSEVRLVLGVSPQRSGRAIRQAPVATQVAAARLPAAPGATSLAAVSGPANATRGAAGISIALDPPAASPIHLATIARSSPATVRRAARIDDAAAALPAAPSQPAVVALLDPEIAAAVTVAVAWTAGDDARLAAEQRAFDRAAADALAASRAPEVPPTAPVDKGQAVQVAAAPPAKPRVSGFSFAALAPRAVDPWSGLQRRTYIREPRRETPSPWIVAAQTSRGARLPAGQLPHPAFVSLAAATSDDADLNDFLARIRQRAMPARAGPMEVEAAVALLESIIARVRAL